MKMDDINNTSNNCSPNSHNSYSNSNNSSPNSEKSPPKSNNISPSHSPVNGDIKASPTIVKWAGVYISSEIDSLSPPTPPPHFPIFFPRANRGSRASHGGGVYYPPENLFSFLKPFLSISVTVFNEIFVFFCNETIEMKKIIFLPPKWFCIFFWHIFLPKDDILSSWGKRQFFYSFLFYFRVLQDAICKVFELTLKVYKY